MGAIKDVIDLVTQLADKVQDRKLAGELLSIQKLTMQLQTEHADLHEANIKLREERLSLREKIQELEFKVAGNSVLASAAPSDVPACPNCSTNLKPFYMSPLPSQLTMLHNATHICSKCKYMLRAKK